MSSKQTLASYFRNFIFGVEDSLVSTVGLLSGIAVAGVSQKTIFLTGVVLIFVEAFSMAVGSFLSGYSAEEYVSHKETASKHLRTASMVMFASYFISGFIPLSPYLFFPVDLALNVSIGVSLLSLFILGFAGGEISKVNPLRNGFRMLIIGGCAIGLGVLVGRFVNNFGLL